MRYLYSLDELLAIRTNGWSCVDCGQAWADVSRGLAAPASAGFDPDCQHPMLQRATLAPAVVVPAGRSTA